MRARHIAKHPYCQCPEHEGQNHRVEGSRQMVVDHIEPHRGDTRLFFDDRNLQTLTAACHNSWKASLEGRRGSAPNPLVGCDADGNPLNPEHPWYG